MAWQALASFPVMSAQHAARAEQAVPEPVPDPGPTLLHMPSPWYSVRAAPQVAVVPVLASESHVVFAAPVIRLQQVVSAAQPLCPVPVPLPPVTPQKDATSSVHASWLPSCTIKRQLDSWPEVAQQSFSVLQAPVMPESDELHANTTPSRPNPAIARVSLRFIGFLGVGACPGSDRPSSHPFR
jgi:hypothetical protein